MEREELERLLASVAAGEISSADAAAKIEMAPLSDLGYAHVDHQRGIRRGVSEVIYGEGKTADQIAGIAKAMLDGGQERVLITRLDADKSTKVESLLSGAFDAGMPSFYTYYDLPRIGVIGEAPIPSGRGSIVVATGGTSDISVAEEAAITAEMLGNDVVRLYDVGVAGLHRLLSHADEISQAKVIVAVAGMEGALASVIAGLVSCPVIAVPTSVGYGASFNGLSALLSMLNSCASGVSVVNIDNGFGAGFQASLINHID